MRHFGTTIVLVALAMTGAVRAPAKEEAPPPTRFDLSRHVPPETAFYVSIDDLGGVVKRFPKTPLGRTFTDPEMEAFFEKLAGLESQEASKGVFRAAGIALPMKIDEESGSSLLPASFSLALLAPESGASPGLLAAVDMGEHREEMVKILGCLVEQAQRADPGAQSVAPKIELDDRKVFYIELAGVKLCYFWNGGTLVLGTRTRDLQGVLDSLDGKDAPNLAGTRGYRELRRQTLGGEDGLFFCFNPQRLLEKGDWGPTGHALGFDRIRGFGLGSRTLEDGTARTRMRILAPGPHRGILAALSHGETAPSMAKYLPPNSLVGISVRLDADGLENLVARLFEAHDAPDHWVRRLARSLGSEAGAYLAAPAVGGLNPEYGAVVLVKDAAAAEKALTEGLGDEPLIRARQLRIRGRRYYRIVTKVLTPQVTTVAFGDGVMALGTSIGTVDGLLKRGDGDRPSLAGSDRYRKAVAGAPDGASAVLYVDTPSLIRWVYQSVGPLLVFGLNMARQTSGSAKSAIPPLSWADFPTGEALTRHLEPAGTWVVKDDGGVTAVTRSTLQGELPLVAISAGLGAALLYARTEEVSSQRVVRRGTSAPAHPTEEREESRPRPPREDRRPAKSAEDKRRAAWARLDYTNLTFFRFEFRKHRKLHAGAPPPDLAAYFGPGPARGPQYWSPADRKAWLARKRGESPPSSYVYAGLPIPPKLERSEHFLLIWNREPFHAGRRMALFLDGSIRSLDEETFQKLLAETRRMQKE